MKRLRNIDAAVGAEVILKECDEHSRRSDDGIIERVSEIVAGLLIFYPYAEPSSLSVSEIRTASDLKVFFLSRRPCFDVDALDLEICLLYTSDAADETLEV